MPLVQPMDRRLSGEVRRAAHAQKVAGDKDVLRTIGLTSKLVDPAKTAKVKPAKANTTP
jgi:hypothetical protein